MQHVINKQVIEFTLQSEVLTTGGVFREADSAFRLQQRVSEQFYRKILPILERVFDALGSEDELISFDKLVIDMGAVAPEKMENGQWTEALYNIVLEQARELIRDGVGRRRPVRQPIGAGLIEQWLDYMRTGRVTWNVVVIDETWLGRVLEHLAADHAAVMRVRAVLVSDEVLLRRVVLQHPERFLVSLAEVLTAKNQAALPASLRELELMVKELVKMRSLSGRAETGVAGLSGSADDWQVLWRSALRTAAEVGAAGGVMEIVGELVEAMRLQRSEAVALRETLTERLVKGGPVGQALSIRAAVQTEREEKPAKSKVKNEIESPGRLPDKIRAEADGSVVEMERDLADGIFVAFAGLVLLHPFLGTFLSRVGLVADGEFVDEAARARAVMLLQYLATGVTDHPEYELVMAKLLCAWPPEAPMERSIVLTAEEKEEADGLLDACLGQWTALQNTSRDGLRGNFLIRSGKLYRKAGLLRLEMERSAFDMLLDQLPWNLSLVRLGWMQEMLHVNWR